MTLSCSTFQARNEEAVVTDSAAIDKICSLGGGGISSCLGVHTRLLRTLLPALQTE